jgi:hypothetical protein
MFIYVDNDPVDAVDPLGLDGLLLIQRDGNRDSQGTMHIFYDGKYQGSGRANENGYMTYPNGSKSHGLGPGTYAVLPKPSSQMSDVAGRASFDSDAIEE